MFAAEAVGLDVRDGDHMRRILGEVDLDLRPGHSYAVTGPSGCGKTSLLSILALVCRPTRGRLLYAGECLQDLGSEGARRFRQQHVGLVFQTFRLLDDLTVREQIQFAAGTHRRPDCAGRGVSLLEEFGLTRSLDQLPRELSGGEKQRVALARALMFAPPIVLADEPTAALDRASAEVAADILVEYAKQNEAIVVVVSHDRPLIRRCCEEISLDDAVLAPRIEGSTPEEE